MADVLESSQVKILELLSAAASGIIIFVTNNIYQTIVLGIQLCQAFNIKCDSRNHSIKHSLKKEDCSSLQVTESLLVSKWSKEDSAPPPPLRERLFAKITQEWVRTRAA